MLKTIHSKIKSWSPFSFSTLKELPRPTLPFLLTPVFFVLLYVMSGFLENCIPVPPLDGSIGPFLYNERPTEPRKCRVLILGSSANGLGLSKTQLQDNLEIPVGKATVDGCWLWEAERILKKYPKETQYVKLVFLDFRSSLLGNDIHEFKFQNGNTFKYLGDPFDSSPDNVRIMNKLEISQQRSKTGGDALISLSFFDQMLPTKIPVSALWDQRRFKDDHETCWNNENYKNGKIELQDQLETKTQSVLTIPETEAYMRKYSQNTEEALWNFVLYCQSRDIFVVLNITPSWHNNYPYFMPEAKNLGEPEKCFVDLCQRLNEHPNCKVLYLRDFHEIVPDTVGREYMFDNIHMTQKGAMTYTNWVTEQIFGDAKILAAIYPPETCQEILAKHNPLMQNKVAGTNDQSIK